MHRNFDIPPCHNLQIIRVVHLLCTFKFYHKTKKAIQSLKKKQGGECIAALYCEEIGDVDIVWGSNDKEHGYGLAYIISEHEKEFEQLGFEVEDFICLVFALGIVKCNNKQASIYIEGQNFSMVIRTEWNRKEEKFLLTAFDLRPISIKNSKRLNK